MPIYDYECKNCGAEVSDVFQKVTDPALTTCPLCNEEGLFRVVTGGIHSFMAGSNTIGSIADKNTRVNKNKINEMEAMKKELTPKKEAPWYQKHASKTNQEINKMTPSQQKRYIMEGK